MQTDQAKRLKELEREDARLQRLIADQALDNVILKRGVVGKVLSPDKRRENVSAILNLPRIATVIIAGTALTDEQVNELKRELPNTPLVESIGF